MSRPVAGSSPQTMPAATRWWWGRLYAVAAGACDGTTGLLLLVAPGLVLILLGIPQGPADTALLRWIGVFVGGVGLSYLYPFLLGARPPGLAARLTVAVEVTALVRGAVAAFLLFAVLGRAMPSAWLSVAATDAALAVVQLFLRRRGFFSGGGEHA